LVEKRRRGIFPEPTRMFSLRELPEQEEKDPVSGEKGKMNHH